MLLPVFVESWQIECCGEPFAIDQVVQWRLLFSEAGRRDEEPHESRVTLTAQAEPIASELCERDRSNVRLRVGSAALYWSAPEAIAGAVTVNGTVHEDHHGSVPEDFPATTGVVRRIRVESRDFSEDPPRSRVWVHAESNATYRDVITSPKSFDELTSDTVPRRSETGVLVDLEVDD